MLYSFLRNLNLFRKILSLKLYCYCKRKRSANRKLVFFISTPTHGNLGDQAIVYGQYKIFDDLGYGNSIVEIKKYDYIRMKEFLPDIIDRDDIIIIDGGGNIGTLWLEEEKKMRDIITRFSDNSVFIFPQTAFFDESDEGECELEKSISVYNKHTDLVVFCRDDLTYKLFQEKFANVKSFYTPDMVLYLQPNIKSKERKKVFLCLRGDKEKNRNNEFADNLKIIINNLDMEYEITTTVENICISKNNRKAHLIKKWNEFAKAKVVITDRLHGMIFCAITGTPCIAIDNLSHKVKNGYLWIESLPYIYFAHNEEEVFEKMRDERFVNNHYKYNREFLLPKFNIIKKELMSRILNTNAGRERDYI